MTSKTADITGHSGAIYDMALWDKSLFTASADRFVARWNLSSNEQDGFAVQCSVAPYSLAIDNQYLWFGLSNGDLHVVNLREKKEVKYFQQHRAAIFTLVHIPQKFLVVAGDADGNLSIWDVNSLTLILFLPLDAGKIRKINVKSDGELFVVHGQDDKIRIFETTRFNEIITLPGHVKGSCCSIFSKFDDNLLVSGGKDGLLKIWNWTEEKLIQNIPAHNFAIYDLKNLNDQYYLSASRDKSIKIWNGRTHEFVEKLDLKKGGHKHSVNSICILNETQFLSCSDDKKVIKWQLD